MKFDEQDSNEAIIVGDIKSNSVSIDVENINFIVTILSTNLYSNPIQSFVRETVSNAWDSHVEAGVKEPVILTLGVDTEYNYYCSIKDFGVGLSPERFEKIYKNIGSSTKRDGNEQIGGFGIGRFSALAYSDTVYITSIFEGKEYLYMMYKDGNRISIDLLYDKDTTETNGLEVKVNLKNYFELPSFTEAIKSQLIFFENLYINFEISFPIEDITFYSEKDEIRKTKSFIDIFNSSKIKNFGDFSVSTLYSPNNINILLGKVAYPLRFYSLGKSYPSYFQELPIFLNFEIGDLDVTPNREEILYSEKNISVIQNKLDSVREYIDDLIEKNSVKDYTSAIEYSQAIEEKASITLFEDPEDPKKKVSFSVPKNLRSITYKGKNLNKDNLIDIKNLLLDTPLFYTSYSCRNNNITSKSNYSVSASSIIRDSDRFCVCDVASLKNYAKDYIRENFRNVHFISPKEDIRKIFFKFYRKVYSNSKYTYSKIKYDTDAIRLVIDFIKESVRDVKVFSNSSVSKSYIEERKKKLSESRKLSRSSISKEDCVIKLYKARLSERDAMCSVLDRYDYDLCSNNNSIDKDLVVYSERDAKNTESIIRKMHNLFHLEYRRRRLTFVEVPASKIEAIKNFTNFITVKEFLNVKYKEIRKLATAYLIKDALPYLPMLSICGNLSSISIKLNSVVGKLNTYVNNNTKYFDRTQNAKLLKDILDLCRDANYYDEEMKGLLMENLTLLKRAECIKLFMEGSRIPDSRVNLCVDYILARKLFRPNLEAVKKLREETIFNIKES